MEAIDRKVVKAQIEATTKFLLESNQALGVLLTKDDLLRDMRVAIKHEIKLVKQAIRRARSPEHIAMTRPPTPDPIKAESITSTESVVSPVETLELIPGVMKREVLYTPEEMQHAQVTWLASNTK